MNDTKFICFVLLYPSILRYLEKWRQYSTIFDRYHLQMEKKLVIFLRKYIHTLYYAKFALPELIELWTQRSIFVTSLFKCLYLKDDSLRMYIFFDTQVLQKNTSILNLSRLVLLLEAFVTVGFMMSCTGWKKKINVGTRNYKLVSSSV